MQLTNHRAKGAPDDWNTRVSWDAKLRAGKMVDANVCLTALGGIPSHTATKTVDVDEGSSSPAARFPKVPLSTHDLMHVLHNSRKTKMQLAVRALRSHLGNHRHFQR